MPGECTEAALRARDVRWAKVRPPREPKERTPAKQTGIPAEDGEDLGIEYRSLPHVSHLFQMLCVSEGSREEGGETGVTTCLCSCKSKSTAQTANQPVVLCCTDNCYSRSGLMMREADTYWKIGAPKIAQPFIVSADLDTTSVSVVMGVPALRHTALHSPAMQW